MDYSLHYYDLVLVGVASAMLAGAAVGLFTPVSLPVAVVGFGLLAISVIGHGLFVNGPVDEPADLVDEVEPEELPVRGFPTAD